MSNVILKVNNLKTYFFTRRGVVKAVDGVEFELKHGECLCLVGESGCGKTVTALSILRLFDSPPGKIVDGQISYDSLNLTECSSKQMRQIRGKDIAMVFQEAQSALNPVLTIGDQITEQMKLHLPLDSNHTRERAMTLLSEMGIPSAERVMGYYPHQLSGGMKQRVLIAMSLSCNPQILIADEPTTAVDVTIKAQILDIFRELKAKRQMSTIFITHDLAVVSEIGDRAVVMYGGKDVETAPVSEIIGKPKHPYTRGLIDCLPDSSKSAGRLTSIPGTTPNPVDMPTGCTFHPRCPKAMKICSQKEPPETAISKEHKVSCHLYT
ncbi:MAG: dipeptide/oligopeptide/nickel ABC transporter ATP-binding protein [Chloroflexi bacterium RBG_13_48_17]|nr:MAG: dipeptide/oligopeptide/nickel ABC transporter ATP-binding protein [Chloroflexi bacterium RBG_13_48_17]